MCNEKRGLGVGEDDSEPTVDVDMSDSDSSDSDVSMDSDSSLSGDDDAPSEGGSDVDLELEAEDVPVDDEDELVKAIKAAKEQVPNHPPDIKREDLITDICFHPVNDLLAVSSNSGDVFIYSYSDEANELVTTHELHASSCRDVEFNQEGTLLYSISKDKSIMVVDMESGKLKGFYDKAHENPLYSLNVLSENTFVTGDEKGTVRMWDLRHQDPVFSINVSEEYISDMITNTAGKYLVCTSGDGAMNTINMNARKIYVQTEEYESELTCLGLFKNETKILSGSQDGKMYLFNWGEFGLHCDQFMGLKQPISCMVPITENIAVISGDDGLLRAIHLFPHKHLGIVGQHSTTVDLIDISNNGNYIASACFYSQIRFWNILYFEDYEVDKKKQNKKKAQKNNLPSSKMGNASDFFSGMS